MPKGKVKWSGGRGTYFEEEKKKKKKYDVDSQKRESAESAYEKMSGEMAARDAAANMDPEAEKKRKARKKALQKLKDEGWSKY